MGDGGSYVPFGSSGTQVRRYAISKRCYYSNEEIFSAKRSKRTNVYVAATASTKWESDVIITFITTFLWYSVADIRLSSIESQLWKRSTRLNGN